MDWIRKLVRILEQKAYSLERRARQRDSSIVYEFPPYTKPEDFEVEGEFETYERTEHTVGDIEFTVDDRAHDATRVRVHNDPTSKEFWTVVHYIREYGVPGVWKEKLQVGRDDYRIGALYCIGPFELTERETDYLEYGERRYEP